MLRRLGGIDPLRFIEMIPLPYTTICPSSSVSSSTRNRSYWSILITSADSGNFSSFVIDFEQNIHLPLRSPSLYYKASTWFKVSLSLSIGAAVLWYLWNFIAPSSILPTTSFLSNLLSIGSVSYGGFNQKFIRVDCFYPRYLASILNISFVEPSYFRL